MPQRARVATLSREEGQAAIEFFLILPLFIVFFLWVVDLTVLGYQYVSVVNAVREGARWGAVNCGDGSCTVDDVRTRVLTRARNITLAPADVTVVWIDRNGNASNSDKGDSIAVKVNHPYSFVVFPWWTGSINVFSCADMRLERNDVTTGLPTGSGCP